MLNSKKTTMLCTILMAMATGGSPAGADDGSHWYVSGGGTLSLLKDIDQQLSNAPIPGVTASASNQVKSGGGWFIAAGRQMDSFRLEAEIGWTRNKADAFDIAFTTMAPMSFSDIPQDAKAKSWRFMANAYYDFGSSESRFRPYLGGGLGIASLDWYKFAGTAANPGNAFLHIDDKDSGFAWQAMAGTSIRLGNRMDLIVQYRWLDAGTYDLVDVRGEDVTASVKGHNIDFGLRYSF